MLGMPLVALKVFGAGCSTTFFGIPTWYEYLTLDGQCHVSNFVVPDSFGLIFLALLDILLRIAGLVSVGYIVFGGIQYITSQGEPDKTKHAQQTIINALIGLVVAVIAAALVAFLGNSLG